jgi:hypothetical protein
MRSFSKKDPLRYEIQVVTGVLLPRQFINARIGEAVASQSLGVEEGSKFIPQMRMCCLPPAEVPQPRNRRIDLFPEGPHCRKVSEWPIFATKAGFTA